MSSGPNTKKFTPDHFADGVRIDFCKDDQTVLAVRESLQKELFEVIAIISLNRISHHKVEKSGENLNYTDDKRIYDCEFMIISKTG